MYDMFPKTWQQLCHNRGIQVTKPFKFSEATGSIITGSFSDHEWNALKALVHEHRARCAKPSMEMVVLYDIFNNPTVHGFTTEESE